MSTLEKRHVGGFVRPHLDSISSGHSYRPLPHKKARSHPSGRDKLVFRRGYDKDIVVVVTVIILAGLASLSTAYYLLMTTVGSPRLEVLLTTPTEPSNDDRQPLLLASDERYLAYLPHSGFHNQRIALENALVLAHILNRTLLLPPIRLGIPLSYAPFDELYQTSANSTKAGLGLDYCRGSALYDSAVRIECQEYSSYTHISWHWLVDLPAATEDHRRVLEGWNFTDAWLEGELDIFPDDIYYLKDSDRNEISFQDFSLDLDLPARKYLRPIHTAELARRPERLIQLGTLFGSSRLYLRSTENRKLRGQVRKRMAFTNPTLVRAADAIRTALGGAYLGVHLRLGDGVFEWNAPANARLAWWKLLRLLPGFSDQAILALEQDILPDEAESDPPLISPDAPAIRTPHPPLPPFPLHAQPALGLPCRAPLHTEPALTALNAPLFISTDAHSPSSNLLLERFRRTFPCTFFLEDFPEQVAPLMELMSPVDDVRLGRFLMPFLDAMVVGQAWQVVGTEHSTFSAFVTDVLWRTYHGFDIVQRG